LPAFFLVTEIRVGNGVATVKLLSERKALTSRVVSVESHNSGAEVWRLLRSTASWSTSGSSCWRFVVKTSLSSGSGLQLRARFLSEGC
jgi:hypothetical protein